MLNLKKGTSTLRRAKLARVSTSIALLPEPENNDLRFFKHIATVIVQYLTCFVILALFMVQGNTPVSLLIRMISFIFSMACCNDA
jgi:hypothetical protein